jgi:hypothetical protein
MAHRLKSGDIVAPLHLVTPTGEAVVVPDPDRLVHLQLRRFAGCPVCHLHLRSVVRRHDEIVAAGIREVVVFHSPAEGLVEHVPDLPFAVVADPTKALYAAFGVEPSVRALLDPRAWWAIVRGIAASSWAVLRRRGSLPPFFPPGGRYGRPADLLLAPDGTVVACKYGEHADDQWSVDELLHLALAHS